MIKCVYPTQAAKLGFIAATYRTGNTSMFGSCPMSCPLLPLHRRSEGSANFDKTYLQAERLAVPPRGLAWSYTHFAPHTLFKNPDDPKQSAINISAENPHAAARLAQQGYDTTYTAPHTDTQWPRRIDNVQFVRCPAETNKHITCQNCGSGQPLCARQRRSYVIVFVAHGGQKRSVATKTGGCYAANFPCKIQWQSTITGGKRNNWNDADDPDRLVAWAKHLPPGTLLRHRIAGDLGIPRL